MKIRIELLTRFLACDSISAGVLYALHGDIFKISPDFYRQLAQWYAVHGEKEIHRQMFCVVLFASKDSWDRSLGSRLVPFLTPDDVVQVTRFMKGKVSRTENRRSVMKFFKKKETLEHRTGLFMNLPGSFKTAVKKYLVELESDMSRFDRVAMYYFDSLKTLYATLRIRPSHYAQTVLFDNKPPVGSVQFALKSIAKAKSPAKQAEIISSSRIPFRIAIKYVKKITPELLCAFVEVMTDSEIEHNVDWLREQGAFDFQDCRVLIERRLKKKKGAPHVPPSRARSSEELLKEIMRFKLSDAAEVAE